MKKQINGMVDVGSKEVTKRIARASSTIKMSPKAFKALVTDGSPKGDVFETAKLAGIMAAKATSNIIPMCHPLLINGVDIDIEIIDSEHIEILCTVSTLSPQSLGNACFQHFLGFLCL